jgi:glutamate-1-semialdehyde 2,1-aminomutase
VTDSDMPTASAERSRALYERGRRSVPVGTHSNTRFTAPHPRYFARAHGAHLTDLDGNTWLDFVMGNGAVLLGHGDAQVNAAIAEALDVGLGAGVESALSIEAAELFLDLVPNAEQVRFANTGTEAVMHAVHLARAVTGRPAIAKVEGAYHGWWDDLFVSTWPDLSKAGDAAAPTPLPGAEGLRADSVAGAVLLPFNDLAAARTILTRERERVAALLIEPAMIDIGFVPPREGYLEGLRALCSELGIVLIFDELLTGFRLANGGAQEVYGVTADLSLWGKGLANGFPIAAVAGRRELMERSGPGADNAPFFGTFNGYRPALAACKATLEQLRDGTVVSDLNRRSAELAAAFDATATEAGVPAKLHAGGGHLQPYFTDTPVTDYRSAATTDGGRYGHWRAHLSGQGLWLVGKALLHGAFSAAHDDHDLERYLQGSREALQKIAEEIHA